MSVEDYPDFLVGDGSLSPTEEEAQAAWEKFLLLDLTGRRFIFGNRGGDMWRVEGVISSVSRTDEGINICAHSVKYFDEESGDPEPVEEVESEELILSMYYPPEFGPSVDRDFIILSAGLAHGEYDIGFIT